jgi:hypothetical protein
MLKVFLGFVVSVVVLLSSAYVPQGIPKAYAASTSVLITQIQAGGVGAPTKEFIVIYNNSPNEVDISGWCLTNKNNVMIVCFGTSTDGQSVYVPGYKHAVAASTTLTSALPPGTVTSAYAPISQSSGSITSSNDIISLIDHSGMQVDQQSWKTTISAGMQFQRRRITNIPEIYQDTNTAEDWSIGTTGELPANETTLDMTTTDMCPNVEGVQILLPVGKVINKEGDCVDLAIVHLNITELLPNAIGSDKGQEFIEFHNPNNQALLLSNYTLHVGPNYDDSYNFPDGAVIQPQSYLSFSNKDILFTLLNSSSNVRIALKNGTVVSEDVPAYVDPKDGESWALINNLWQYTNQPTPGAINLPMGNAHSVIQEIVTLQTCAANQYNNPETNRCRTVTTEGSLPTPCKDTQYRSQETSRCRNSVIDQKTVTSCSVGEERNPDSQRCRKIVVASQPTACKEGQERNPDTNRCRTMTKMPTADYGVLGTETKSGGNWYVWLAVGGVLLLALGYAVWEWHDEIGKFLRKCSSRILRFARIRK